MCGNSRFLFRVPSCYSCISIEQLVQSDVCTRFQALLHFCFFFCFCKCFARLEIILEKETPLKFQSRVLEGPWKVLELLPWKCTNPASLIFERNISNNHSIERLYYIIWFCHNALISGHPRGLTPGTNGGIARDLLTFVATVLPGTGALDRFCTSEVRDTGKDPRDL